MMTDYTDVTELPGAFVSTEQIYRAYNRYIWTAENCKECDVLEVACGAGLGFNLILEEAKSLTAGDFSEQILRFARNVAPQGVSVSRFDAQKLPFADAQFDRVVIHEALYYLPDPLLFFNEAKRVLRPGGQLLITNVNKDIKDFHPSPHTYFYHGVTELNQQLTELGFSPRFWGFQKLTDNSTMQLLASPIKRLLSKLNLLPKSMKGKLFLRRIVFGKLIQLPRSIDRSSSEVADLTEINSTEKCISHKIIFCSAIQDGN